MIPRKARSDLWFLNPESMLLYDTFPSIIEVAKGLCAPDMAGKPSAIVSSDQMLHAALEIYQQEAVASGMPFRIGVFRDRESALQWLKR